MRWYKDNIELPEYIDVDSITCNKPGSYVAKIFYVPLNKELMSFEPFCLVSAFDNYLYIIPQFNFVVFNCYNLHIF